MLAPVGKLLIYAGAVLIVAGLLILFSSRFGVNRLPGDLVFQRGQTTFFFPIATCLLISLLLSIGMSLLARWRK